MISSSSELEISSGSGGLSAGGNDRASYFPISIWHTRIAMALLLSSSFVVVLNHLMTVEVVAAAKETAPASCHWREVELCTLGFTSLLQNPNGIPLTEPDLKRQCEYMKESKDCLDQYEDKCLTDNQSSLMALFGGDLSDMASEFCDTKSDLRANYTKFGPCLRKVQREVQLNCVTDLRVGFEQIHKANISQRLIIGCCNFNRLKECIMPKIEEKCGDDSVDFVSQLVHRAFGSPLEMLCRDYDPLAFYCTSVLPPSGTKPHNGQSISALSRVVSSFASSAQVRR